MHDAPLNNPGPGAPRSTAFHLLFDLRLLGIITIQGFRPVRQQAEAGRRNRREKTRAGKAGRVRAAQRDQSFCAFSKELLKRAATTRAALKKQPAAAAGPRRPAGPAPRGPGLRMSTAKPCVTRHVSSNYNMSPPTSRDLHADPGGRRLFRIPEELGLRRPRSSRRQTRRSCEKKGFSSPRREQTQVS